MKAMAGYEIHTFAAKIRRKANNLLKKKKKRKGELDNVTPTHFKANQDLALSVDILGITRSLSD